MSEFRYEIPVTGITQTIGGYPITIPDGQGALKIPCTTHQITILNDSATAGTVDIMVRPSMSSTFEPLLDNGTPVSVDLTTGAATFVFIANIQEVNLVTTGVNGNFNAYLSGW